MKDVKEWNKGSKIEEGRLGDGVDVVVKGEKTEEEREN